MSKPDKARGYEPESIEVLCPSCNKMGDAALIQHDAERTCITINDPPEPFVRSRVLVTYRLECVCWSRTTTVVAYEWFEPGDSLGERDESWVRAPAHATRKVSSRTWRMA